LVIFPADQSVVPSPKRTVTVVLGIEAVGIIGGRNPLLTEPKIGLPQLALNWFFTQLDSSVKWLSELNQFAGVDRRCFWN
jgi:hypothetical protein